MTASPIYLDNNATTPIDPRILDHMLPYLRQHHGNPSSGHVYGSTARAAVEMARGQVADLLGCEAEEIVFTAGGTEANNLAITGVAQALATRGRHVITTAVEHPATALPCAALERLGWEITRLPVDPYGRADAAAAHAFVRGDTALLTVMLANNETGTIMPVRTLADIAHARGAIAHTDAAQAVGKVPVRVKDLGVDLLSLAGHKLYAPKGVGALYIRRGTPILPVLLGAGQERGLRPGTENVACIVGLGKACEIASGAVEREAGRLSRLRDELWARLRQAIPGIRLNGHATERLPNTLNVSFPGTTGVAVLRVCPEIAASTGSACHDGSETPSAVLTAMGLDDTVALGAVRISLGRWTTLSEIRRAASCLARAYHQVRFGIPDTVRPQERGNDASRPRVAPRSGSPQSGRHRPRLTPSRPLPSYP